jgi:hypothetical protein
VIKGCGKQAVRLQGWRWWWVASGDGSGGGGNEWRLVVFVVWWRMALGSQFISFRSVESCSSATDVQLTGKKGVLTRTLNVQHTSPFD